MDPHSIIDERPLRTFAGPERAHPQRLPGRVWSRRPSGFGAFGDERRRNRPADGDDTRFPPPR